VIDGIPVFDCVVHAYDLSEGNIPAGDRFAETFRDHLLGFGDRGRAPENEGLYNYARRWDTDSMYEVVFGDGLTDLAMAQAVPIFEWTKNYFAPVDAQYAFAQRHPKKVIFCGAVDPLEGGPQQALEQLDHQIRELGARSVKFYNAHVPRSWRCDDVELAYPLYERCLELGVTVVQFHKGQPLGLQNIEDLRPNDIQAPARDFPDLRFVIHHLALPYFDEAVSIAGRFRNVYLALSGNLNTLVVAPRLVQKRLGRLLHEVGSEKLMWGSEAALAGPPGPYLRAFMDLTIPDDLRDGYGFPQITVEDRKNVLGRTFARLMGIDLEAHVVVESASLP
jgi:predicted TIM-barrel fold metal-dependent hydrolase